MDNDTYELLIELMGAMDTQFQFWLTVTSAFVAAHYVAGSRLGGVVRGYLSFVYLCSCILITFRILLVSELTFDLIGSTTETPFSGDTASFAGGFRLLVILFGTLGALAYSVFHHKIANAWFNKRINRRSKHSLIEQVTKI